MTARRYIAVVQAPEGYPAPNAPLEDAPSVPTPILHSVVHADDYEALHAENVRLREALTFIASTDPVDAALDPDRAVRVARAALNEEAE